MHTCNFCPIRYCSSPANFKRRRERPVACSLSLSLATTLPRRSRSAVLSECNRQCSQKKFSPHPVSLAAPPRVPLCRHGDTRPATFHVLTTTEVPQQVRNSWRPGMETSSILHQEGKLRRSRSRAPPCSSYYRPTLWITQLRRGKTDIYETSNSNKEESTCSLRHAHVCARSA